MEPIRFKFKYLAEDGSEAGFLSKKGAFDGATLTLDKTPIAIEAVTRATTRFNRLILNLLQNDGTVAMFGIAITGGNAGKLMSALNRTTSARWAELSAEKLQNEGRGHIHRARTCPYCEATVELTGLADSPQMFCPFCDSIVTWRVDGPVEEADLHICDGCGFYSRPRGFTIMYFYFLLVVYGYRYRKVYHCNSCMRPEAWKMLFGNAPFLLGVPVALTQLFRVYTGGGRSFAGLDQANALAKRNQTDAASAKYEQIEQRLQNCASVRFNHGLTFARASRWEEAAEQLRSALKDCSNFSPAYGALCAVLEKLGQADELADLKRRWGVEQGSQ